MEPSKLLKLCQTNQNVHHFDDQARAPTQLLLLDSPQISFNRKKGDLYRILPKYYPKTLKADHCPFHYWKGYTKTLKAQKFLLKLQCPFHGNNKERLSEIDFLRTVKGFSSLSSCNVKLKKITSSKTTPCKTLLKCFASLKNLISLDILFNDSDVEDIQMLQNLLRLLKRMKKLTSFSLHFSVSENYKELFCKVLSSKIRKLSHLSQTQITITFKHLYQVYRFAFLDLFKALQKIETLSSLTLDFSFFKILETDKEPLRSGLSCLNPALIRRFPLEFYRDVSNEDLIKFCGILNKFNLLTALHLSLWECHRVGMVGISELCNTLSSLVSLRSLNLTLNPGFSHDPLIENIILALKSLRNLVFLKLDFSFKKTTTKKEIQKFFSNIGNLKCLKFLILDLPWMTFDEALTDNEFNILGQSLKELILLQNLSLSFGWGKLVTKSGIETIIHAVQHLKNLSSLKFEIKDTIQIYETTLVGQTRKI